MREVQSDVDYFAVVKTMIDNIITDIRVVYNATSYLFNEAVWAPSFMLPTADTAVRQLSFDYHQVDLEMGEMFLNFPMPTRLQSYLGVRTEAVVPVINQLKGPMSWRKVILTVKEVWTRMLMGFRPSPYNSVKHYYHAEEFIIGDHAELDNPFRWDRVILNLTGQSLFDPRVPWVYKKDDARDCIAGAAVTFVDDSRASGKDAEHAWQVGWLEHNQSLFVKQLVSRAAPAVSC